MSDSRKRRSGGTKSNRSEGGEQHRSQTRTAQPNQRPKSSLAYHSQRGGGFDYVRQKVQEEGRTARNLVQYSVPLLEAQGDGGFRNFQHKRAGSSSRSHPHRTPPPGSRLRHRSLSDMKSPRSVSGSTKNVDLRARYWKYMFDNFQRAVDSIYQTCEQDESVVECKEVIMMLEQSTQDFKALISRMHMLRAYEETAKDGERPAPVAWEVRKMSPNKHAPPSSPSPAQSQSGGNSWADKVKGCRHLSFNSPNKPKLNKTDSGARTGTDRLSTTLTDATSGVDTGRHSLPPTSEDPVEEHGWETVQRGRLRARYSPCQKSTENLAPHKGAKRSLMRSMSVPDQAGQAVDGGQKGETSTLRAVSEKHLPEPVPRQRTVTEDSEKENIIPELSSSQEGSPSDVQISLNESMDGSLKDALERQLSANHDTKYTTLAKTMAITDLDRVLDEEFALSTQLQEAQESALAYAVLEEENWLKELAREQSLSVEDLEVDISDLATTNSSLESHQPIKDWDALVALHEAEMKISTNWGELVVEAEESRTPGHGVHMHEKLSSPSRKSSFLRSPTESRRRHEEKQAKAQELREKLMSEKAERLRDLSKKVDEVRAYKEELMRQSKTLLEHKLQRAEHKRSKQLKLKSRKAHDEEAKANEIAFINSLEAQNKKHEIMSKHQECEARLHEMMEQKMRKHEEKQAKEAAVEDRRRALEADRKARLMEMQEKRKLRDARISQQQQEKEKERLEAMMGKAKEREERMAALNAHEEVKKIELQKKIQQKQDETTQRHEEYLQHIKDRAFEMSITRHSTEDHNDAPRLTPYHRNKLCNKCNVLIPSEVYLLSHLRGKKHQQALRDSHSGGEMTKHEVETFNLSHIVDAPDNSNHPKIVTEKERQKSLKKRCKKLRQRMITRGVEYEGSLASKSQLAESEHKAKLQKVIKDISKYLMSQDSGPWPTAKVSALDRALGEIGRILERKNAHDQTSFRVLGGFSSLSRILLKIEDSTDNLPCVIPAKSLALTSDVIRLACKANFDSCHYILFSNKIGALVDHLIHRLNVIIPEDFSLPGYNGGSNSSGESEPGLPFDPVCSSLMQTLAVVLVCLGRNNPSINCSEASSERMVGTADVFTHRGNDIISYIISVGVMDRLRAYLSAVRGPVDEKDRQTADFLLHALGLLVAMVKFMSKRSLNVFPSKRPEDPSQLISTFEVTELVGIVSLLYGMLLHQGAPERSADSQPPELPVHTISIILTGLRMLNHMAVLDLPMMQKTLGEEGLSLEFRHIASYLVWYCSHAQGPAQEELLHEVLLCVGYFTVLSPDNQAIIQAGQPPTVLQQMCSLPFTYFSDPRLVAVLLPCLVCCCYNNSSNMFILQQELSPALLANFIEEKQLELQQTKIQTPLTKKSKTQDQKELREAENRMSLGPRFPQHLWEEAKVYFSEPPVSSPPTSPVPSQ